MPIATTVRSHPTVAIATRPRMYPGVAGPFALRARRPQEDTNGIVIRSMSWMSSSVPHSAGH